VHEPFGEQIHPTMRVLDVEASTGHESAGNVGGSDASKKKRRQIGLYFALECIGPERSTRRAQETNDER